MAAHSARIYEADSALIEWIRDLTLPFLSADGAAVVIATPAHRGALARLLRADGVDLDAARRDSRYVALDAEQTLSHFMRDGVLDREACRAGVREVLGRVSRPRPVVVGEVVALLATRGERRAAMQLERYWNELLLEDPDAFELACGYPASCLEVRGGAGTGRAIDEAFLHRIRHAHTSTRHAAGDGWPIDILHTILASAPAAAHPASFFQDVAKEFGVTQEEVARGLRVMEATGEVIRVSDDYWRACRP
ncbi:MAG: MEDS domain-containing protein [Dehalococcoidia bacterium]|nr:MEDS domain-containing protein [Dehalococcoidia bacterium]